MEGNNMIKPIASIENFSVGMIESYKQTILEKDIELFAKISGDFNPVHLDENYASNSRFKKRIAHGLLSASFFSALFGMKLPGNGCVYVAQSLNFRRPVYIGDEVLASIEIIKIDKIKSRLFFKTICKANGKVVIDGEAEIFIP
jgi:3-hydroxybutyryl-CoA dehydratase